MRWFLSKVQSISGWLTPPPAGSAPVPTHVREAIREAMLDALGAPGAFKRPQLAARIRTCRELETLWVLRTELMMVLAQAEGESHAREVLAQVTELFAGLLPHASQVRHPRARAPHPAWPAH